MKRVGKHQLQEINRALTVRQAEVLEAVGGFRFMTGPQITRLTGDQPEVSQTSAARVVRRDLARLTDLRILARLDRRVGGIRAGSDGFIYTLGPVGARLLVYRTGKGVPRSRIYYQPGDAFIDHALAVTEILVRLKEAERQNVLRIERFDGEPKAWRTFVTATGVTSTLKPDGFLITSDGVFDTSWFVEVDRASERRGALERKLGVYLAYLRSGKEQAAGGVFPRVIWLVPDRARRNYLKNLIEQTGAPEGLFAVALQSEAVSVFAGLEQADE